MSTSTRTWSLRPWPLFGSLARLVSSRVRPGLVGGRLSRTWIAGLACLGALSSAETLAQTVYNTSSFGILASDGLDDTVNLQTALATLGNGDTLVFNQTGVYELSLAAGFAPLLSLSNVSNVTITASVSGVRLVLTHYDRSNVSGTYPNVLQVNNCPGFTLKGLNSGAPLIFDTRGASTPTPGNDGLPFVQGTVVSITPATNTARIKVTDPAMFFPFPLTYAPLCWAWTYRKASPPSSPPFHYQPIHAQYNGSIVPAGAASSGQQLVDVVFQSGGDFTNWSVGGDVVAVLNDSETYAILANQCSGTVTFRDLVAHHLPGKFLQVGFIQNLVVDNVDVTPATPGRRLSVNRDGINAGGESLLVQNCDVVACGDDGIVAHGTTWGEPVLCSHNPTAQTFMLQPPTSINHWPAYSIPGQLIVLVDRNTMSASSSEYATVVGWPQLFPQPNGDMWLQYTYMNPTPGFAFLLNACSAPSRAFAFNPSYSLSGGLVQSCTVAGNRGIGIVVRALNTQIAQCTISDTLECGIHAGGGMVSAYPWWGAGAPPHYLAIQNCTLTRTGDDPHIATKGAIEIAVAQSSIPGGPCLYYINPVYSTAGDVILDVTLTGNMIREFPRAGVFAANVGGPSGIHVTGNTFLNSGPPDMCHPEHGFGVAVETCGNGLVQGNQFLNCFGKFWQHQSPNVLFIP